MMEERSKSRSNTGSFANITFKLKLSQEQILKSNPEAQNNFQVFLKLLHGPSDGDQPPLDREYEMELDEKDKESMIYQTKIKVLQKSKYRYQYCQKNDQDTISEKYFRGYQYSPDDPFEVDQWNKQWCKYSLIDEKLINFSGYMVYIYTKENNENNMIKLEKDANNKMSCKEIIEWDKGQKSRQMSFIQIQLELNNQPKVRKSINFNQEAEKQKIDESLSKRIDEYLSSVYVNDQKNHSSNLISVEYKIDSNVKRRLENYSRLFDEVKRYEEELKFKKQDMETLEQKSKNQKYELKNLKLELEEKEKELDKKKQELEEKKQELEIFKNQNKQKKQYLQDKQNYYESRLKQLESKNEMDRIRLEQENIDIQLKHKEEMNKFMSENKEILEQLKNQNKIEFDNFKQYSEKIIQQYITQYEEANQKLMELEYKNVNFSSEEITIQAEDFNQFSEEEQNNLQELQKRLKIYESKVVEMKEENECIKERLGKKNLQIKQKCISSIDELKKCQELLEKCQQESQIMGEEKQIEINIREDKQNRYQEQLKFVQSKLKKQEDELNKYRKALEDLEKKFEEEQQKNKDQQVKFESDILQLKQDYDKTMNEMHAQIQQKLDQQEENQKELQKKANQQQRQKMDFKANQKYERILNEIPTKNEFYKRFISFLPYKKSPKQKPVLDAYRQSQQIIQEISTQLLQVQEHKIQNHNDLCVEIISELQTTYSNSDAIENLLNENFLKLDQFKKLHQKLRIKRYLKYH
ncbi:unnamed protein product (macronuclear) [Paramecium tetraurelia]|uniref:Uncharacterized protein n=1 Tax=Paramecium tetraurelia TaxID=5888 RepID=A0D878_PARTE|nr:uncharacterized protein GSPATT00014212001 [Paramecium tetraurelia]CAK79245.1 unnamed protein product [Paramecium tetraurelia]|eukprot:XP_001446642.1 hypothetical protein (macronuclear) [Paramecium tetraurelia strain d4-2]